VDEIDAGSRPGSPFSNGTEGLSWEHGWCGRCTHDAAFRAEKPGAQGCPILMVAYTGRTPAEWMEQPWVPNGTWRDGSPRSDPPPDAYHCIEFRDEDAGPEPGPRPVPDPPGQGTLWPREPFEAVRMLTAAPADTPVSAGQGR
jgi:hypothetical protein